jgi:4-diphosphocytidyl-2-C-methyl-D-erythritol kinase
VKIRAAAKINLNLRVVGRRADGYHLLDTIMVPVSLYDEIDLRLDRRKAKTPAQDSAAIQVICDHPLIPAGAENIAYRAAKLMLEKSRLTFPVRIHIRKSIPVGAGLGGGSSDAAAVLRGLNKLLQLRWPAAKLERLAVQLGADVPFFIRSRPARARGIGERLSPIAGLSRRWLVIVYPGFPVATAWGFRNLPQKLTKPHANTSIAAPLKDLSQLGKLLVNDLEPIVRERYPEIDRWKRQLVAHGAAGASMSGSGSSVFGVFKSKRRAETAFRRLRQEEEIQAFLVQVVS